MKKLVSVFVVCMVLLTTLAVGASEEVSVRAAGAVLLDGASGRALFLQNADKMLPMASTTKVMTALLALEHATLTDVVTASPNASGVPGTSIYLSAGERLTMEQLLYGLMLRSGNDAAVAIAEHVAGDAEKFAEMMNARAAELGVDAHFENPHGLDAAGHASSARALALILREALKNPDFREITATRRMVIPWDGNEFQRVLSNKNRLLADYEGATGGKTGFTNRAGRCLAFSAERDGLQLVGAVLSCPNWFGDAEDLLDWGFANYHLETALVAGTAVREISVRGGLEGRVDVLAGQTLAAAVGNAERCEVVYALDEVVRAPILKGQVLGTATLRIDGEDVLSTPLIAARDVEERSLFKALRRILRRWGWME